ncbi:MAG: hypothetical protein ACI9R8_001830 [Candidatus Paceibacteria bacterium]|jgi:hypothetical protein
MSISATSIPDSAAASVIVQTTVNRMSVLANSAPYKRACPKVRSAGVTITFLALGWKGRCFDCSPVDRYRAVERN